MTKDLLTDAIAHTLVSEVFSAIDQIDHGQRPKDAITKILNQFPLVDKVKPDIAKFPRIRFDLSIEEVEHLKAKGLIDSDNRLTGSFSSLESLTSMEKLLYSVLWKQGDLGKERHIINGISSVEDPADGLVFNYFGRHLANKLSPIVDQHVIRAFRLKCVDSKDDKDEIRLIRTKDIGTSDKAANEKSDIVKQYLAWQHELCSKYPKDLQADLTYYLDLLLFGLGKAIKLTLGKLS